MTNETKKTCRDILLGEYTNGNIDLQSKLLTFPASSKKYLPLNERIKMFIADNPNGSIECRVLMDNNIFATLEATVTTDSGNKAVAVGKWYHSNEDDYGKNYLKTAQSNAVSSALKYLGYDYTEEIEPEPMGSQNIGEVSPLPFIFDDNQEYVPNPTFTVPQGNVPSFTRKPVTSGITVEQAKSFVMNGAPFGSMTIGDILNSGNEQIIKALKERLVFSVQQHTKLEKIANIILPLMEGE